MVRGSFDYRYCVSTVVCCVNGSLPVTRKMSPKGGFLRTMGGLTGVNGGFWALVVPTKCLPVNARQTHRMLRQEKDSPSAKRARFQGTSVNIADSWAECC